MSSSESFSRFRVANENLTDSQRLNSLFEEEGYLFFRNVLNSDGVLKVKRDLVRVLQEQGVVKRGESEPVWTGSGLAQVDDGALYALDSYAELVESKETAEFVAKLFGTPVFMYKATNIRYSLPGDEAYLTPPHQDHFFVRGSCRFRTLWVPLMDIDEQAGGLALGAGSHKRGLLEHVEQGSVYSYIFKGRKQRGVPLESLAGPWLTTDYHPGDLLVFHNLMVHRAIPNKSDRVRLSLDARCQPASEPRNWQAEKSILEARQIRETAKRIATEEGASEPLFEAVLIELMARGLEPQRAHIKALISELAPGLR